MALRDPETLMEEVRAACGFRDEHLRTPLELVEKYAGYDYNRCKTNDSDLENHQFEFMSLVVPRIVLDNPRVRITARSPRLEELARTLQWRMNQWSNDTRLREPLLTCAADWAFSWPVALISPAPIVSFDPSEARSAFQPRLYRVSPNNFGFDQRVSRYEDARFTFQRTSMAKELLLQKAEMEPGWLPDKIRDLHTDEFPTDAWNRSLSSEQTRPNTIGSMRDEVEYFEVWVPEVVEDEVYAIARQVGIAPSELGFNGCIYTLGSLDSDAPVFIREPRPFFGPSWGPHIMGGCYPVPNQPYPLSPLVATAQQSREVNLVATAISREAANFKQLALMDKKHQAAIDAIKNDPHQAVVPIEDLEEFSIQEVKVGGISREMINQQIIMQQRHERNSGIDDARRGSIPTGATATAVDLADRAAETRLRFMQSQFTEFVRKSMTSIAWYMAVEMMGQPIPTDQIAIEIEPLSMSRPSEIVMQQRAAMKINFVLQIAPLMAQIPYVDWKGLARMIGDATDDPDFERLLSPELAAMVAAAQAADVERGLTPMPATAPGSPGSIRSPQRSERALPGRVAGAQQTAQVRRRRSMTEIG